MSPITGDTVPLKKVENYWTGEFGAEFKEAYLEFGCS